MYNQHEMAVVITQEEGGKVNLSIAQVKEVLRIVLKMLRKMSIEEIVHLLHDKGDKDATTSK